VIRLLRPSRLKEAGILGMNRRNLHYIGRYNRRSLYPLVDDKLQTKLLAEKYGMPTPAMLRHLTAQHEVAAIGPWLHTLGGFAIKPAKGSGGKGILVITSREGDRFVKASGESLGLEDIERHLSNILAGLYSLGGSPDTAIIETLITIDPRFEGYSHEGIPDIRIIIFQGYPVMAMMRLATHASDGKANLHQGALGLGIDISSGACLDAIYQNERILHHPDTHRPLRDIDLPEWHNILMLAARCYEMTGLGYIGTDIVIDRDRGPLLLELNARPGLSIQAANGRGLLPRLHAVEARAEVYRPPEERVAWAREQFRAQ